MLSETSGIRVNSAENILLQAIAEDARIKVEKEQAVAEKMAAETSAMAEDAQKDLGIDYFLIF